MSENQCLHPSTDGEFILLLLDFLHHLLRFKINSLRTLEVHRSKVKNADVIGHLATSQLYKQLKTSSEKGKPRLALGPCTVRSVQDPWAFTSNGQNIYRATILSLSLISRICSWNSFWAWSQKVEEDNAGREVSFVLFFVFFGLVLVSFNSQNHSNIFWKKSQKSFDPMSSLK